MRGRGRTYVWMVLRPISKASSNTRTHSSSCTLCMPCHAHPHAHPHAHACTQSSAGTAGREHSEKMCTGPHQGICLRTRSSARETAAGSLSLMSPAAGSLSLMSPAAGSLSLMSPAAGSLSLMSPLAVDPCADTLYCTTSLSLYGLLVRQTGVMCRRRRRRGGVFRR